jgi:hypothetical protein
VATRLFCVDTLEFMSQKHPTWIGQICYLFIFDELIDAYQSHTIGHDDRFWLALRAYFFVTMWRSFLDKGGYPENRYFISREAADIVNILIWGLILLIIVHHDHLDNFPLLPWLHSMETCEHVFVECRKLIKYFTYLDFLYMQPKLCVLIKALISLGDSVDSCMSAGGYRHNYFEAEGINFVSLGTFPSQSGITSIALKAYEEAESLFAWLVIRPGALQSRDRQVGIPTINSWFPQIQVDSDPCADELTSDSDSDGSKDGEEEPTEAETL